MSGHSHWAKIKRAKGSNNVKRGKDLEQDRPQDHYRRARRRQSHNNLSLRYRIDEAKAAKAQGHDRKGHPQRHRRTGRRKLRSRRLRGLRPRRRGDVIDALTNNRSRTAPDLRSILEKNGGTLAVTGSVAFQFNKRGIITVEPNTVGEEKLMDAALAAGAEDVISEGEVFEVITSPAAMHKVKEALNAAQIPTAAAEITYMPTSTVPLDAEKSQRLLKLIDALEDNDDVQSVSHNAQFSDGIAE